MAKLTIGGPSPVAGTVFIVHHFPHGFFNAPEIHIISQHAQRPGAMAVKSKIENAFGIIDDIGRKQQAVLRKNSRQHGGVNRGQRNFVKPDSQFGQLKIIAQLPG